MKLIVASMAILTLVGGVDAQTVPKDAPMTVAEAIRRLHQMGYDGPNAGPPQSADQASKTMKAFVQCIVSDSGDAGRILVLLPGSEDEWVFARRIAAKREGCLMSGSLRFGALMLRGGIAEGVWHRDFERVGGGARRKPLPLFKVPSHDDAMMLPAKVQAALELQALADCVVEHAPTDVSALLATPIASPQEVAKWQPLMGKLQACIDPTKSVTISKFQLRGILAEAAYRTSAKPYQSVATRAGGYLGSSGVNALGSDGHA